MAWRGRILIVDDEANARPALSEILHEDGSLTETAADGSKGLGKIAEWLLESGGSTSQAAAVLGHELAQDSV